jgi:hypothetical protein
MSLYPGGRGPGSDLSAIHAAPIFYVDDSSVDLAGTPHVLLGAVHFQNDGIATAAVLRCKSALGLQPHEELKWNAKGVSRQQAYAIRGAMLPVLSHARGTVVIHERTKVEAAAALAIQLSEYSREHQADGFACRFDRGIIEGSSFFVESRKLKPPCVGVSIHDSQFDQLIQAADLFTGFQKLRIDIGTGRVNGDRSIHADVYDDEHGEYPLGWYLSVGLRYCLWGRYEGDVDRPTKVNRGLGVRIFSSASAAAIDDALSHLSGEYMGCIH